MIKQDSIRKSVKACLSSLSFNTKKDKEKALFSLLQTLSEFKSANMIGLFVGKDHEPHTLSFINDCLRQGKKICLAKIVNKKELEFRKIRNIEKDLISGTYGILEPNDNCPLVRPHNIQLLCIPAVAVDISGNRIGRGGGYYDRYLEKSCIKYTVSLVFEEQIISPFKPQEHDIPIETIVTEKRIIRCSPFQKKLPKLINGVKIATEIENSIRNEIKKKYLDLTLSIFIIGENAASLAYVRKKKQACLRVGIKCLVLKFKESSTQKEVLKKINECNMNNTITGILVQLPLPKHFNTSYILNTILTEKDVDGLSQRNKFLLKNNKRSFFPCAPKAILYILNKYFPSLSNKTICLIGHGELIGKPLEILLKKTSANILICTRKTNNIKEKTQQSDIIISATGNPYLIDKKYIKENTCIIDAGFGIKNGYCVGDVNFDNVFTKASFITPSPGGVGPLTIVMLLQNIVDASKIKSANKSK